MPEENQWVPPQAWPPPEPRPEPPQQKDHKVRRGVIAGMTAMAVGLGSALVIAEVRQDNRQSVIAAPSGQLGQLGEGTQTWPRYRWGDQQQSQTSTTATDAQEVGIVDINTVLQFGAGKAAGTGIILTSNGEILTNNHVVAGSTSISVTVVSTGKVYTARVVGTDATHDIAVLQLQNASNLATAKLGNSTDVQVGDAVTAVGNAGGDGGDASAAAGTVTALDQSITATDESGQDAEHLTGLIETNAEVQSGDSGGPLYDSDGAVIGIDTAASTGQLAGANSYAIPLATALGIAGQITSGQQTGTIDLGYPAFLGVELGGSSTTIAGVIDGSAAAKAGLGEGDTVTAIAGKAVTSASALSQALDGYEPGDRVTVGWTGADGSRHTATVTLTEGPVE
jgi:S1-C subfamily serine protease